MDILVRLVPLMVDRQGKRSILKTGAHAELALAWKTNHAPTISPILWRNS